MVLTKNNALFGRIAQANNKVAEHECAWLQRHNIRPDFFNAPYAAGAQDERRGERILAAAIDDLGLSSSSARVV
jgi:hypothetical protein